MRYQPKTHLYHRLLPLNTQTLYHTKKLRVQPYKKIISSTVSSISVMKSSSIFEWPSFHNLCTGPLLQMWKGCTGAEPQRTLYQLKCVVAATAYFILGRFHFHVVLSSDFSRDIYSTAAIHASPLYHLQCKPATLTIFIKSSSLPRGYTCLTSPAPSVALLNRHTSTPSIIKSKQV